jgi:hypothetical protein
VNKLGNSGVSTSTAKLDKTDIYEVGPCKQNGSNGSIAMSSQPLKTGCSDEYQNCNLKQNEGHYE